MLDNGIAESRSEIARIEGLTPARITQVMYLLKLPTGVKDFLAGLEDPKEIRKYSERRLEKLKSGETKALGVTFKSIRRGNNRASERLKLPIKINTYSKLPMLTVSKESNELPYCDIKIKDHMSFNFKRRKITVIIADNNAVWFLAEDICRLFGIPEESTALDTLDYYSKTLINVNYSDGTKKRKFIISDYGMKELVKKSTKPIAEEFQKWVSDIVIPQINQG